MAWSYNLDGDPVNSNWEHTLDGEYRPKGTKVDLDGDLQLSSGKTVTQKQLDYFRKNTLTID